MSRTSPHQTRKPHSLNTEWTFRDEKHRPDLWKRLLPSARRQLVDEGLFTEDGKITDAGMNKLKETGP